MNDNDVLGAERQRIPLYNNSMDETGKIVLYENGIAVDSEQGKVKVPMEYVKSVSKTRDMPMAKVEVKMVVYDQMGMSYDFTFTMSDQYLMVLEKATDR